MTENHEIKFRQAITEEDGTFHWHYWGYLHTCTKGLPVFISPRPPLEHDLRPSYQYIGQRDRTSGEIYRGDIITSRCTVPNQQGYIPVVGVVKWNERRIIFYIVGRDTEGHLISRSFEDVIMSELEVIGNTEEKPELLKKIK